MLATAGLALGLAARFWIIAPRGDEPPPLTLEPAAVEVSRPAIQGELLTIYYQLRNSSDRELTIDSFPASCSCMSPVGPDGKPLVTPLVLAGGQSLAISLSIDTQSRVGPQRYFLSVAGRDQDRPLPTVSATITARVLAALSAQPFEIILRGAEPGVEMHASVELADMLPDPGVQVASVTSSCPDRMHAELVPVSEPSRMFGEVEATQRYRLLVRYTPDDAAEMVRESLVVNPTDGKYPALTIPVYCTPAALPYALIPRGLTISVGAPSTRFKRTVLFRSEQGTPPELTTVRSPPNVTVTVKPFERHARRIEIEGETPASSGLEKREILFEVGETKQPLIFPITFLAPDAPRSDALTP